LPSFFAKVALQESQYSIYLVALGLYIDKKRFASYHYSNDLMKL